MNILILSCATSFEKRNREITNTIMRMAPNARVGQDNLHIHVRGMWARKTSKIFEIKPYLRNQAQQSLMATISRRQPELVITHCPATAQLLTENRYGNVQTTSQIAGTTGTFCGVRYLIIGDPLAIYQPHTKSEDKAVAKYTLVRHLILSVQNKPAPEYRYSVPQSVADLEEIERLSRHEDCCLIATDLESQGPIITTVQFTFVFNLDMSDAVTVSIPLWWSNEDHNHNPWKDEDTQARAWACVLYCLASPVQKVQQNGAAFDNVQYMQYGIVMRNYAWDTMIMQHCLFPTTPKSLDYLCSIYLSGYSFWKNEGKALDEKGKAKYRVPQTPDGYYTYLRYGGLDTWYTARLCIQLWREFAHPMNHKMMRNYVRIFLLETGPAMAMSFHGLPVCADGVQRNIEEGTQGFEQGTQALQLLTACPTFNPNSPAQVKDFLYNVLRVPPLRRKGKTTDKRVLQVLAQEYPIIYPFVETLLQTKYERTKNARFGEGLKDWRGWDGTHAPRMFNKFTLSRTKTARVASSATVIGNGVGDNFQNAPGEQRRFLKAEPGHILCMIDYSQADVWHMAAACGDPRMIDTVMTPGNDSHSIHAADFFSHDLQDILDGKENGVDWVVDYHTGVRNLVKKVVHGTNYGLQPEGMVINIGRVAAIGLIQRIISNPLAAPAFMQYLTTRGLSKSLVTNLELINRTVPTWPIERLALGCAYVQDKYMARYPGLTTFLQENMALAIQRDNKVLTTYGPHHFRILGDLNQDDVRRFIASGYGQAGTSGTINNAMLRFYYHEKYRGLHALGIRLVGQIHDELLWLIPNDKVQHIYELVKMMEVEAEFNGTKFVIPVEVEVSTRWGKKGAGWKTTMLPDEIVAAATKAGEL